MWSAVTKNPAEDSFNKPVKNIVFPQDRLQQRFESNNPAVLDEPVDIDGRRSTSARFADAQWTLMKGGMSEQEAYRSVKDDMKREKHASADARKAALRVTEATEGKLKTFFEVWADRQREGGRAGRAGTGGAGRGPLRAAVAGGRRRRWRRSCRRCGARTWRF
jgi:hypothetical protein